MKNTLVPPADKETRNHTGSVVAAVALLVGWTTVAVTGEMQRIKRLARTDALLAAEQLEWITRIVTFALSVLVLVLGAWILWVGHRICRTGEFPPPGMRLIRPLRTCTGRKARIIGWLSQLVGLLVFAFGATATWLFARLAQTLLHS